MADSVEMGGMSLFKSSTDIIEHINNNNHIVLVIIILILVLILILIVIY